MDISEKSAFFPRVAGESRIGLVRKNNEDSYVFSFDPVRNALLVAVADGVGGNGNGDLASRTVCRDLLRDFRSPRGRAAADPAAAGEWLLKSVETVNARLLDLNDWMENPRNMSTTVAAGVFLPGHCFIVWAGDSRVYAGSPGKAWLRCTRDHSLLEELRRRKSPLASSLSIGNVITRSIGSRAASGAELKHFHTQPGERFFFCSDGVLRSMSEDSLGAIVLTAANPQWALRTIMFNSLRAGGVDNLTGVAVFLPEAEGRSR